MDPISEGASGAAVEDVQDRLTKLGYAIDATEMEQNTFGSSTAAAVAKFRLDRDMPFGMAVDTATWSALVDDGYELGDRTLYLRLPNFHGNDVRQLQERLNILGFSAGAVDGYFGAHTEAAVKEFQESQGALADGMAFADTFDAIDRLHHVWAGKPAAGPHPMGGMGFARAADVLERRSIAITGDDPIARNVAGRVWNLASATTDKSGLDLVASADAVRDSCEVLIVISSSELEENSTVPNVTIDDVETLPQRMRAALGSQPAGGTTTLRIELPHGLSYDGTFTTGDSQTFAVMLLDAICSALDA